VRSRRCNVIALAALELLSEAASNSPVLVLVEDAQWRDRPSADVLAFVARRVESDPLLLLAAIRSGYEDDQRMSPVTLLSLSRPIRRSISPGHRTREFGARGDAQLGEDPVEVRLDRAM
jgi:hypothetical protein